MSQRKTFKRHAWIDKMRADAKSSSPVNPYKGECMDITPTPPTKRVDTGTPYVVINIYEAGR